MRENSLYYTLSIVRPSVSDLDSLEWNAIQMHSVTEGHPLSFFFFFFLPQCVCIRSLSSLPSLPRGILCLGHRIHRQCLWQTARKRRRERRSGGEQSFPSFASSLRIFCKWEGRHFSSGKLKEEGEERKQLFLQQVCSTLSLSLSNF